MSSILQRLSLGKSSPSSLEDWPDIAREHLSIMSPAEIATVTTLVGLGQQHVFAEWESMGINDDLKHGMLSQAEKLISSGLADYLKRAKTLLSDSKNGENPFTGWTPSVPSGVALNPELERGEFEEFEALGMTQIGRCGFVLVAGGLGERLGFNGIKVSLPAETLTFMSFLELYCQQILNIQERYTGAKTKLPLAIMVSDDTLGGTLALLQQHSFFGLDESQVTILKQEKVAALSDNDVCPTF